ncbi:uncharacterized protein [Diadema antillarum]|uniref:uncharacterized protein n=1 Tax=Diadema antillarum TaxID=105358 RepID=UPI003A86DBC1
MAGARFAQSLQISATCRDIYASISKQEKVSPDGKLGTARTKKGHSTQIPPHSKLIMTAQIRNPLKEEMTVFVESNPHSKLPSGLHIAPGVQKLSGGAIVKVRVLVTNSSPESITVPGNCPIVDAYVPDKCFPTPSSFPTQPHSYTEATHSQVSANVGDNTPSPQVDVSELPINWGPISPEWKERLLNQCRQRSDVFSRHEFDLGSTGYAEHQIRVNDDTPFRERSRRVPPSDLRDLQQHLQQLLENNIIKESKSPYASPIVLVRKKNGTLRMCVDYRTLNSRTIPDQYTVPLIQEAIDSLSGSKWFSVIDLKSGFYQIPMREWLSLVLWGFTSSSVCPKG